MTRAVSALSAATFTATVSAAVIAIFGLTGCGLLEEDVPQSQTYAVDDGAQPADEPLSEVEQQVAEIVADLNLYWSEADAELGFDYRPVPLSRVSTGSNGVTCDRQAIEADEVEDNAFVDSGCAEGITVAYDPDYVGVSVARAEGTLAHEWGHVIQAQATELDLSLDPDGLPIDAELQADCFAGAWAAERGTADYEAMREDLAEAGDPHGVPIDDPDSHGNADQRVEAFEVGFQGGPTACVDELIDALP
jgi:predicted metalloprotease